MGRRDKSTPKNVQGSTKQSQRRKVSSNPKVKKIEDQADPGDTTNTGVQLDPSPHWYQTVSVLAHSGDTVPHPVTTAKLAALQEHATSLHTNAVLSFQAKSTSTVTSSSSEFNFLHNILQSGTLSDRLSALTLLVQSSPLHNTKALETLKSMAERGKGKGGREESLKALRCIIDWWVGGGAPDRKLRYFRDQPLTHPGADDAHLLVWFFEDWLKKYFFAILQILETLSTDPLPYVRTQALSLVYTLLQEKPEQEHNLLRLLVNKLGDPEKSICSRTSYHVLQLLQAHPAMKQVVIREITALILKPSTSTTAATSMSTLNARAVSTHDASATKSGSKETPSSKKNISDHGRYYAVITFNQVVFGPGDRDIARQVIDIYFRLFEIILREGRLESVPEITGGNNERADTTKFKHNKKVAGDGGFTEVEDTHSKLISAILTGINRALPFARLGVSDSSFNKHIDTLFLITHTSTFNISLQALVLIQHICSSLISQPSTSTSASSLSQSISDRYYRTLYSSLQDGRLASSSKQTMYLNLLFKSLRADENEERVKSFVRRFIQFLGSGGASGTEFVVGGLYLLGEVFSTIPGLRPLLQGSLDVGGEEYDPRKRDPQFAHPSALPLYELLPLLHHYHPTVSLHAHQLLSSQPITSSPDLTLNTLTHFLDRFVYKNPKKPKPKGASAMQPAASTSDGVRVRRIKGEINSGILPNEDKFWKKPVENIPVEEVFFHKYFLHKNRKNLVNSTQSLNESGEITDEEWSFDEDNLVSNATDIESVSDRPIRSSLGQDDEEDSDVEEGAVWKAMKATMRNETGEEPLPDSDSVLSDLDTVIDQDDEQEPISETDAISLAEQTDDEDLIAIDDIPGSFLDYDGSDAESGEEWRGFGDDEKRKRQDKGEGKRKKRKALPTFASYEDYARMIEGGPEDDI